MSVINKDYSNRRDFLRMFVDATVDITDPVTGDNWSGDGKNISGKGLMFVSEKAPAVGALLEVVVSSRQSKMPPLHAQFCVMRVQNAPGGLYEIGGELSDVH